MNQKDYLKTPEHFRELVQAMVDEQLQEEKISVDDSVKTESRSRRWRYGMGRTIAAAVVLAMLVGTTTFAAVWHFRIPDIVPGADMSHIKVVKTDDVTVDNGFSENLTGLECENMQVFEEPLLKLTEIYYDGMNLYLYGVATKAGEKYEAYTSRVVVNGKQYLGELTRTAGQSSRNGFSEDEYIGWFILDGAVGEQFTAEMPMSIYPRYDEESYQVSGLGADGKNLPGRTNYIHIHDKGQYSHTERNAVKGTKNVTRYDVLTQEEWEQITGKKGQQTLTFEVSRDASVVECEDQYVEVSDGITLSASDIIKTAAGIRMNVNWHLSPEAAVAYEERLLYQVSDDKGNVYKDDQIRMDYQATVEDIGNGGANIVENEDGTIDYMNKLFIKNMPQDVTSMTIQLTDQGKAIDGIKAEISLE